MEGTFDILGDSAEVFYNNPARSKVAKIGLDLSICIVTYNVCEMLDMLLTSIYQNTKNITFEVLVVDNASTDGVQEIVKKYPIERFVQNDMNLYFTRADNQNLSYARGRYVVTVNPDTLVLASTLERMVRFLDENPDVGAVTPKFVCPNGDLQNSLGHFPTLIYGILEASGINTLFPQNKIRKSIMSKVWYDPNKPREGEVLYGACIMVRRAVLERVGLKDERLVFGWDEYDWCKRIVENGWRLCYVPEAVVIHHRGASKKRQPESKLSQYHWDGFFYLYRKYWGIHVFWLLKMLWYTRRWLSKTFLGMSVKQLLSKTRARMKK